jgi:hypothetical protein
MVEGAKVISQEELPLDKSKEGGLDTFPVVDPKFDRFLGHTKKCINKVSIISAFENFRGLQHLYDGVGYTSTTPPRPAPAPASFIASYSMLETRS